MHKSNGYPCNNFINHATYFKSTALRITERCGHFLMIRIIIWHFYSFILIFTNKDLSKYERRFMKHAIDQFSIQLYRRIFADKVFSMFINSSLRQNLLDHSSTESLHWLGNSRLGSIKRLIFPNFIADFFLQYRSCFLVFLYRCCSV